MTKVLALTLWLLIAVAVALALFVALRRMRRRGVRAEYTSPVFCDPTGVRWLVVKRLGAFSGLLVTLLGYGAYRGAATPPALPEGRVVAPFRGELGTVAVLGSGPLLRVLRVVERDGRPAVLLEPFTAAEVRSLTSDELAAVGASAYVVDRYGYDIAATRNLALTFDDGPDERYTPALLDILAREKVPATFFVTGEQAARHPDIVRRIAREGHVLGNHTFTHADMSVVSHTRAWMELVATDRVIRAGSGVATDLFRVPYEGDDPGSQAEDALAILRAQQYGYVVAGYDFDTSDWQQQRAAGMARIGTPELDGTNHTLLLHDAGGDRQATLDYVRKLIRLGRRPGTASTRCPR